MGRVISDLPVFEPFQCDKVDTKGFYITVRAVVREAVELAQWAALHGEPTDVLDRVGWTFAVVPSSGRLVSAAGDTRTWPGTTRRGLPC